MHSPSRPALPPVLLIIFITACVDPPEQVISQNPADMGDLIADMTSDMTVDMRMPEQDMAPTLEDMPDMDMVTTQPDEGIADMPITDLCENVECGALGHCDPDSGACVACLEDAHCESETRCDLETFMCICPEFEVSTNDGCKLITGSPCDPMFNRCVEDTACISIEVGEMSAQNYCLRPENGGMCMAPWYERIELTTAAGGVYCSVDHEKFSPEAVRNLGRACSEDDDCGGLGGECIDTSCTYACIVGTGVEGSDNCAHGCDDGYCQAP